MPPPRSCWSEAWAAATLPVIASRVGTPLFPEVDASQCAPGFYSRSRGDQEGTYGVCTWKGPLHQRDDHARFASSRRTMASIPSPFVRSPSSRTCNIQTWLQDEVHTCTMRSAYADSSRRPELQEPPHTHVVKNPDHYAAWLSICYLYFL